MNDLDLYRGGSGSALSKRDSRWAAGQISRGRGSLAVRDSFVDNETDLGIHKGESLTGVIAHGMTDVGRIGQLEQDLATRVPAASGRLAMLADQHSYSMVGLVMDHERRLRRQ